MNFNFNDINLIYFHMHNFLLLLVFFLLSSFRPSTSSAKCNLLSFQHNILHNYCLV